MEPVPWYQDAATGRRDTPISAGPTRGGSPSTTRRHPAEASASSRTTTSPHQPSPSGNIIFIPLHVVFELFLLFV